MWAAVRIPDDHVAVSANAPRIRKLDLADKEHFLASANVHSLAEELGCWSTKSGEPFEFCTAYGSRSSLGSRRREWRALSRLAPSLKLDPNAEHYPLSVKAERKLSVKDVLDIFRDTYQDTPFDMTRSLIKVDARREGAKNPIANPFMSQDYLDAFNITSERTIACKRATYLQVTQSRGWLPNAVGGLVWLGYDNPMTTPHTPFYIGITQMPASYMVDGREKFRRDCAWWAFRQVSQLATLRWQDMVKDIERVWRPMEEKAFADQAKVEEEAVRLLKAGSAQGTRVPDEVLARPGERRGQRLLEAGRRTLVEIHEYVRLVDGVNESRSSQQSRSSHGWRLRPRAISRPRARPSRESSRRRPAVSFSPSVAHSVTARPIAHVPP